MNSVIWPIDPLIASGSFSWLPCLLAFLSILSAWLSRVQQGEPAFLPASLPLNSVGVWCYKNKWGRATLSVPWDCDREKREVCFCSCPLQTGSSLIGSLCFLHFCFFPQSILLVCKWQAQLCWLQWTWLPCWPVFISMRAGHSPFRRMPGQLIAEAKMKKMLEWLTVTSRRYFDFQVQYFPV